MAAIAIRESDATSHLLALTLPKDGKLWALLENGWCHRTELEHKARYAEAH